MKLSLSMGRRGAPDRDIPIASRQSRPGWARYVPLVLSPATGPFHCTAAAYKFHPAGRRQESRYLCGNLVFGPPYLKRRHCVLYARRTCLMTDLHHTHSASWAGLAFVRRETQTSTCAVHRRALLVRMAFPSVACGGRTSAHLAGAPSGSALVCTLVAPLPFAVRSRPTADGRRERADFCRWPYIRSVGCVPTPARLCRALLAFIFDLPVWRC